MTKDEIPDEMVDRVIDSVYDGAFRIAKQRGVNTNSKHDRKVGLERMRLALEPALTDAKVFRLGVYSPGDAHTEPYVGR
jgi:hypothetical protein